MMRSVKAIALVFVLVLVTVSPANANANASGRLNCSGDGRIAPLVDYAPFFGASASVKQAGPPTSPTWTADIPKRSITPLSDTARVAWVSPYDEGSWSAHTDGAPLTFDARANCTHRNAPSGSPVATYNLGDKSCSTGGVKIQADGLGDIWVTWKSSAGAAESNRNRVKFDSDAQSYITFNTMYTRDAAIFDVVIKVYRGNISGNPDSWMSLKHLECGTVGELP